MAKLSDGQLINTVNGQKAVLTADDGQQFRINMSDLAEVIRKVMPVATGTNNGLFGYIDAVKLSTISFNSGASGGEPDKWYRIGSYQTGEFRPIRMLLDYGTWNLSNRTKLDVTIVAHPGGVIATGSINDQTIGYVISGNRLDVFFKLAAGKSLIGTVIGGVTVATGLSFDKEPNGIVYF